MNCRVCNAPKGAVHKPLCHEQWGQRHNDRPQRQSDAWIVHAGWVCLVIGLLGLVMLSLGDAKKDKRIYMMEQTINRLAYEVGDCKIKLAGPQPSLD